VAKRLAKLGVIVLERLDATVTEVMSDAVQLTNGRKLRSEVRI
jgi:hypothetical protein